MESAIFGLVGVIIGSLLAGAKEWWFQHLKRKKDAEYLSIQLACALERYMIDCGYVAGDHGRMHGTDPSGRCYSSTKPPDLDLKTFDVEWRSLPLHLMYEIIDFPFKAELVKRHLSDAYDTVEYPDGSDWFEERQLQYAIHGLEASKLAAKLRQHSKLPARAVGDWDIVKYLESQISEIGRDRNMRAAKSKTLDL